MHRWAKPPISILLLTVVTGGFARGQITTRESVHADGSQLSQDSGWNANVRTQRGVSISADGRFVAYASLAAVDPRDQNGLTDVYVRDRLTGAVTWASGPPGGGAWKPALSADGRWCAFLLGDETGGSLCVRGVQSTRIVNFGAYRTWDVAISATGRYVAFATENAFLDPNDTNLLCTDPNDPTSTMSCSDIYVCDRDPDANGVFDDGSPTFTRTSVSSTGVQTNAPSYDQRISDDGRFTAFTSYATNLVPDDTNDMLDVFVHDAQTGTTTRVSVTADGQQVDAIAGGPSLSADGRYIAFETNGALVPTDTDGLVDVYLRDLQTNEVRGVTNDPDPNSPHHSGGPPVISADGTYLIYHNGLRIWGIDLQTGVSELVNTGYRGLSSRSCEGYHLSADGRFVAFATDAPNLVADDNNGRWDVFVRDRLPCGVGTVRDGSGTPVAVLSVNNETDVAFLSTNTPTILALNAPPSGPAHGAYLVWAWIGLPVRQSPIAIGGIDLGCAVNPTPFGPRVAPQPFRCVAPRPVGSACNAAHRISYSAASTPWHLRRNLGFSHAVTLTFQGILIDNGAANPRSVSITNAVYLVISG
ncbi:MAG: PD40 domain-containing protein [Planctomycetes bacterium]|nr:PD40 domain-containing protein [Planctomycetota bacterium]